MLGKECSDGHGDERAAEDTSEHDSRDDRIVPAQQDASSQRRPSAVKRRERRRRAIIGQSLVLLG
jgi:hypothetical protein